MNYRACRSLSSSGALVEQVITSCGHGDSPGGWDWEAERGEIGAGEACRLPSNSEHVRERAVAGRV